MWVRGATYQAALAVGDTGIATSGDYRNCFERGRRYSHLIDPVLAILFSMMSCP